MIDEILSVGCAFDWISPLLAFAQSLAKGPSYTFLVPWSCGWSGRDVARLLKDHGVESWGYMVVDHTLTLSVRQRQANWAQYVLEQSGVPLENPLADHTGRRPARVGHPSAGVRGSGGQRDAVSEILDLPLL